VKNIAHEDFLPLVGCAFLIFWIALAIRMSVIFWHRWNTKNRYHIIEKRFQRFNTPEMERLHRRFAWGKGPHHHFALGREHLSLEEALDRFKSLLLTKQEALIIGWSGMRGIVSLAAALSLPLVMADGEAFPQRDVIIFLTVAVVILMLVIQGLGLPLLVKLLKKNNKTVTVSTWLPSTSPTP
jgi:CPA1 family monovalent cation:H+ antiporter